MTIVSFLGTFFRSLSRVSVLVLSVLFVGRAVVEIKSARQQAINLSVDFFSNLAESSFLDRDFLYLQRVSENFARNIGSSLDLDIQITLRSGRKLLVQSAPVPMTFFTSGVESKLLPNMGEQIGLEIRYNFVHRLTKVLLHALMSCAAVLLVLWFVRRRLEHSLRVEFLQLEELGHFVVELEKSISSTGTGFQISTKSNLSEVRQIVNSLNVFSHQFAAYSTQLRNAATEHARLNLARQLAHDIRSPLTALRTVMALEKNIAPERKEMVSMALQRISSIATDLLNERSVSEVPLGPAACQLVSIDHVIAHAAAIVREKQIEYVDSKGVTIRYLEPREIESGILIRWSADFDEAGRVLSNLINNGIESLNESSGEVSLDVSFKNGVIKYLVEDTGVGMSQDLVLKIRDQVYSTKKDGHGFGLKLAREFVTKNSGTLDIVSQLGQGTTVSMLFQVEVA